MKLNYIKEPSDNGGSAISGCGTIHVTEIKPTLDKLSKEMNLSPVNLNDFVLGSTGKREYSGDIDLVLDRDWCRWIVADLIDFLRFVYGKENVARNGDMVHLKYPIVGFDNTKNELLPRTGFVQIDFNIGNAQWERVYHASPGDTSAYKGGHRNLAIAAITAMTVLEKSEEVDTFNRPIRLKRWKWSPHGFIQVLRTSKRQSHTNVWMRKQDDQVTEGPYFDTDFVAKVLFEVDGTAADLESLETIMAAVKRNYGMTDQERIWKRIAENFQDWKLAKEFAYPPEIEAYFNRDDK